MTCIFDMWCGIVPILAKTNIWRLPCNVWLNENRLCTRCDGFSLQRIFLQSLPSNHTLSGVVLGTCCNHNSVVQFKTTRTAHYIFSVEEHLILSDSHTKVVVMVTTMDLTLSTLYAHGSLNEHIAFAPVNLEFSLSRHDASYFRS